MTVFFCVVIRDIPQDKLDHIYLHERVDDIHHSIFLLHKFQLWKCMVQIVMIPHRKIKPLHTRKVSLP